MKYLICLDLDGTTLYDDESLSTSTIDYINKIKEEHIVCIVTGRPLRSSKKFYDLLELDTLIANYNGTKITHPKTNEVLVENSIPNKLAKDFYNKFENDIPNIFVEVGEVIYVKDSSTFASFWGHEEDSVTKDLRELDSDFSGCVFLINASSIEKAHSFFSNTDVGVRVWQEKDENLLCELYLKTYQKGTALEFLKEYYKGNYDKTVAIGDSHNDLDMFKVSDISVAMQNAKDGIKKRADHVSEFTNKHDGVINFLKTIIKE